MARKAEKPARGRPSRYTPAIAEEIFVRLGKGEPLEVVCRDEHMPASRTVHGWMSEKVRPEGVPEDFSAEFAQARARGFDAIAADCLRIADTPLEGVETTVDDKGTSEKRGDMLGHRKLQIDTRLKLLAKWDPKRYGDKLAVGGAEDLPPMKTDVSINEVARRLAFTLYRGMKTAQAGQAPEGTAGGDDAGASQARTQVRKP